MNSRRSFMDWINKSGMNENNQIEMARFLNVGEKEYVYSSLDRLVDRFPSSEKYIMDFKALENQRYQVFDSSPLSLDGSISEIRAAILFCSKSEKEKQKSLFKVHPNLAEYLVKSNFLWNADGRAVPKASSTSYLIIPSYLNLAPKELCLVGLNSLFLDLIDFSEQFSFQDFLYLVADALEEQPVELIGPLMEFITAQILYYRTFLVTE